MYLHEYVHVVACRLSMYSHAELSCTHMTVVAYLQMYLTSLIVMHVHTRLSFLFAQQRQEALFSMAGLISLLDLSRFLIVWSLSDHSLY